jgi:glycosyltransferase involved in cell wall biosynthesis
MPGEEYRKMREKSEKYAYENWDWAVLAKKLAKFLRCSLACL